MLPIRHVGAPMSEERILLRPRFSGERGHGAIGRLDLYLRVIWTRRSVRPPRRWRRCSKKPAPPGAPAIAMALAVQRRSDLFERRREPRCKTGFLRIWR